MSDAAGIRGLLLAAVVLAAAGSSGEALAAEPQGGWYIGATVIGAYAKFDDFSTSGFLSTVVDHDDDWVVGLAARAGYSWKQVPIRAELELAHRYRFDLDLADGLIDYEGNVGTTTLLATAIAEWRNSSSFRPFAGLTLGWAHHFTDTERTDFGTGERRGRDRSQDNFAWGGVVGIDWDFSPRWSAEAAYRYLNMGRVTTGTLFSGERIEAKDYVSHELLLSVLYRFPQ